MVDIEPGKWTFNDVITIYHYGSLLKIKYLRDLAARRFITLGPVEVWNINNSLPSSNLTAVYWTFLNASKNDVRLGTTL